MNDKEKQTGEAQTANPPSEEAGYAAFYCGPRETCPDGTKHDYSEWEEFDNGGTGVCSKCGARAIDNAMWY